MSQNRETVVETTRPTACIWITVGSRTRLDRRRFRIITVRKPADQDVEATVKRIIDWPALVIIAGMNSIRFDATRGPGAPAFRVREVVFENICSLGGDGGSKVGKEEEEGGKDRKVGVETHVLVKNGR